MAEHPPPPVITIVDPSSPLPLSDVIGEEPSRPPRRLSTNQRRLAALVALIVVTAYGGIWAVSRVREGHRLDREAVAEVSVDVAASEEVGGALEMTLQSTGAHPVRVLSARLEVPGYPSMPAQRNLLKPHDPAVVSFDLGATCTATAADLTVPKPLVLRVRTYRGQETTVRLPSSGETRGVQLTLADVCGLFPPGSSLVTDAPGSFPVVDDLVVTLPLHNRSREVRTITGVTVSGGLQVISDSTPLALGGLGDAELTVRLRVTDCPQALQSWAQVQPEGFGIVTPGSLDVVVEGSGLTEPSLGLLTGEQLELTTWVETTCGS